MKHCVLLCTGGIGCGKSYVVKIFNALGIPSYDCDSRVKSLYDSDPLLCRSIEVALGGGLMDEAGRIDRRLLSSRVFSDKKALATLENMVYPSLLRDFQAWKEKQRTEVVLIESAILLDKPSLRSIPDLVLTVTSPEEMRIMRVMERDDLPREEILRRISNQNSEDSLLAQSDFTICNDGQKALLPQILDILKLINEKIENGKN